MTGVVAHLIAGGREEPFLEALLESLDGAVDCVIVNDNAPDPSPHTAVFARSAFARAGRLIVDRSAWVDFSTARNRCLQIHRELNAGPWIAYVDTDEVHGAAFRHIAANVVNLPPEVDFVDAYMCFFFQSFDWYESIGRHASLFRFKPDVHWSGSVHEQLVGLSGRRVALPYLYGHYGDVLPVQRYAEKGRLYTSLGASGGMVPEDQVDALDVDVFFQRFWRRAMRFTGAHPAAVRQTIAELRERYADNFAQTERLIRKNQSPLRRIENAVAKLNYEQRWRLRVVDPLARMLMP